MLHPATPGDRSGQLHRPASHKHQPEDPALRKRTVDCCSIGCAFVSGLSLDKPTCACDTSGKIHQARAVPYQVAQWQAPA